MNEGYFLLFETIALGAANLAEKTMEQNKKDGNFTGYSASKKMRDKYLNIRDKARGQQDFVKEDWGNLLIATKLMIEGIKGSIAKEQQVLEQYEKVLIPKISEMIEKNDKKIFEINN